VCGLVTDSEFQQLPNCQTISEVETILGQHVQQLDGNTSESNAVTYVWQNRTDSTVTCVFEDDRLVKKNGTQSAIKPAWRCFSSLCKYYQTVTTSHQKMAASAGGSRL